MKRLICAAAMATALSLTPACRPVMVEPLRSSNMEMYTPGQLGLAKGRTGFHEAKGMMADKGMTGISSDMHVLGETVIQALSADYQTGIHIFESGRYSQTLEARCGPVLPYGYKLRLATSEGRAVLLAFFRDPLELTFEKRLAHPPRMSIYSREDGRFRFLRAMVLERLAKRHGGLTSPLFVGHDLDFGIVFLARSQDGRVWDNAYHMKMKGKAFSFSRIPIEEAEKCSCVRDYIYGI